MRESSCWLIWRRTAENFRLKELKGLQCPLAKYVIPLYVQQKWSHSCQLMTTIALASPANPPCPRPSNSSPAWLWSEIHIKRQAAQHGRLPRLLGDGDKGIEKMYGEEKNILYWAYYSSLVNTKISCTGTTVPTSQPRNHSHLFSLSPFSSQFQSQQGPSLSSLSGYTAKTQYRKFPTDIPRKGTAQPQSQFQHSFLYSCERFLYSHDWSAYSAAVK